MKKIIIAAAVILTVSITSCSKETDFDNSKTVNLKSLTDDASSLSTLLIDGNKLDISQADGNI